MWTLRLAVGAFAVRDAGVATIAVEPPTVERAFDLGAFHPPAVAQMGAEVRAERVLHVRHTFVVPPNHQVLALEVAREHRAGLELV